ncbi:MAG: hypothetical protein JNK82_03045, partial [Myxococcaceae bacterium]|nr:hypothetical protein [Myxococcaceae bacterium]
MRACAFIVLAACGGSLVEPPPMMMPADAGDPEWEALLDLTLPANAAPPADTTNRVADDAAAAAWGQALFFDTSFSGTLLESDNDGRHNGVGMQGQTNKVSCAS